MLSTFSRHALVVAALLLLPLLAACDTTTLDDLLGPGCREGTFTAAIDGQEYLASCIRVTVGSGTTVIEAFDSLEGTAATSGRHFRLRTFGTSAGTYNVPSGSELVMTRNTTLGPAVTDAMTGQMQVSEQTKTRLRGTFALSGEEVRAGVVTDESVIVTGEFDIEL